MTPADDLLLRGIRILRHLEAADEAPWPGARAIMPNGEGRLLVETDILGLDWPGWSCDPDGHVASAIDVLRTARGHLAVLAPFRERLEDAVDRRRAAGAPLTEGEIVTLAVSLLRGCAELPGLATGEWWLDDDARPVFAATGIGEECAAAAQRMLDSLIAEAPRMAATLTHSVGVLGDRERLLHEAEDLEERLFATATPEPLALNVFTPRRARALSVHSDADAAASAHPSGVWASLARHVDADLADTVSQATTAVWRRLRRSSERPRGRARRGGPLIAAGAVMAVIVGGAALLPAAADPAPTGDASSGPTAEAAAPTPSATATEIVDAEGSEAAGVPSPAALADTLARLLDARGACAGDLGCLREIVADPAAVFPTGAIDLPADERSVTVLDEFGDVAVLRVGALSGPGDDQIVVIARENEKWLLRDVHDVAEQP